ncbi:MAG: Ig-like domain-containing protein, partial [Oscillospiraceae bacterium]|nr:Ig-like domain-containing protein [Oscillospiraceae bacterium]
SLFIFPVSAKAATAVDITISVNEIRQIRVTPKESFSTKWRTSDRNIVMVSKTGKIKGIAEGKATVTATAGKSTLEFNIIVKKAEEPVLLPNAPEIVFILLCRVLNPQKSFNEPDYVWWGLFIDNKGKIKEFTFADEDYEPGFTFMSNYLIKNYGKILESGNETEQTVDSDTLKNYYKKLLSIDKNTRVAIYNDKFVITNDEEIGYVDYYGLKKDSVGKVQVALLKGRGNIKLDNIDPNAEEISQWLITTISFEPYNNWGVDYENYHNGAGF